VKRSNCAANLGETMHVRSHHNRRAFWFCLAFFAVTLLILLTVGIAYAQDGITPDTTADYEQWRAWWEAPAPRQARQEAPEGEAQAGQIGAAQEPGKVE
jgi:hypothetical protein